MKRPLLILISFTLACLAAGVAFSMSYWGYAWSLPELDSRVRTVRWTAIAGFKSNVDGAAWTKEPEEVLVHHLTQEADDECCATGRIVEFVQTRDPVTQEELSRLEKEFRSVVTLEPGEPGYQYAARLSGVVATGFDSAGHRVAFTSFNGGEVSNDHYAMYEVFLQRDGSELLSSRKYYADIAGIEGFSAGVVALCLSVPAAAFLICVSLMVSALRSFKRRRG